MAEKADSQRAKDQARAAYLKDKGEYHGYRHAPWNQGISYPHLGEAGSAKYRRARKR